MPSICLALPFLAYVARLTRNSLLDVMSQNYMRTAKAKGLDDATALARHALKVAILPVITYLGPMAAYVLTGSFVVETVFNISGVGGVFVNAIQNRDCFLLTGAVHRVFRAHRVLQLHRGRALHVPRQAHPAPCLRPATSRWTGSPPNGWQVLRRNRVAMISLWFVVAVALFAVVTPFFLREAMKKVSEDSFFPPLQRSRGRRAVSSAGHRRERPAICSIGSSPGAQVSLGVGSDRRAREPASSAACMAWSAAMPAVAWTAR